MSGRERILALCLGGVIGGVGLVKVVQWTVFEPFKQVHKAIDDERARQQRLEQRLADLRDVEVDWRGVTKRTLSADPVDAQRRFREDLHHLLELHALADAKVSPGTIVPRRNGFIEVPLTISATGTLDPIVQFLADFYRRDYIARIDKLTIGADSSVIAEYNNPRRQNSERRGRGRNGARDAGGEGEPELRLSMSVVTLVLPPHGDIRHVTAEEVVVADAPRGLGDAEALAAIGERSLFAPYHEVRAVVAPPPENTETVDTTPRPVAPPPTPPPPPPPNLRLVAVVSLTGTPQAYFVNEDDPTQAATTFKNDEAIFDGSVLLIMPKGLVMRAAEEGHTADYFLPLGALLAEREELHPDTHPELVARVRAAFAHAEGS